MANHEAFLGGMESVEALHPEDPHPVASRRGWRPDLPGRPPTRFGTQNRLSLDLSFPVPPWLVATRRHRNINLFPIGYVFRPRLRDRLTLRRLTLRRKPWAFGVRVFHPH